MVIIKLGYCETLVNEAGFTPSLGDVFRHTVLLHHYKNDRVTWITSKAALPLLQDNPYIHELMVYDNHPSEKLANREFDELLCLEKSPTLCKFADSINAKSRLGFGRNKNGVYARSGAKSALDMANGKDVFLPMQAVLFQMVNSYWDGEGYILGYKPRPQPCFDVGFNFLVGKKWPSKRWPMKNWEKLRELCVNHGLSASWQTGAENLNDYMDWLNAGKLIVTCDSLGMHLALAMRKKVVVLFGPTPSEGIYMYGRGIILTTDWACPKSPCMQPECDSNCRCMSQISPKTVARTIINLLNGDANARHAAGIMNEQTIHSAS